MKIGNRSLATVGSALLQTRHYIAGFNMLKAYDHPVELALRYLLARGRYPASIGLRTPIGPLSLTAYTHHDILTIEEIFCRKDYPATAEDRIVVDFGSNIGLSAAWFLTRSRDSFVYLYEPLAFNLDRLRRNLQQFETRFEVHPVAVCTRKGEVQFGWEETGRYGGVGVETGRYLTVPCVDSNAVLEQVVERHRRIDILKIDVEGLERELTERIPAHISKHIRRIYVEERFDRNPLERTHSHRQYGNIAQFTLRDVASRSRRKLPIGERPVN